MVEDRRPRSRKPNPSVQAAEPIEIPESLKNPTVQAELQANPLYRGLGEDRGNEVVLAAAGRSWDNPYAGLPTGEGEPNYETEVYASGQRFGIVAEQRKIICGLISEGLPPTVAYRAAGVYPKMFHEWRQKGGDHRVANHIPLHETVEPFKSFVRDLFAAEISSELTSLSIIRASPDWRAHAWFLERRFKKRWAPDKGPATNLALGVSGNAQIIIAIPDNGRDSIESLKGLAPAGEAEVEAIIDVEEYEEL